jgi:hypothetical protein
MANEENQVLREQMLGASLLPGVLQSLDNVLHDLAAGDVLHLGNGLVQGLGHLPKHKHHLDDLLLVHVEGTLFAAPVSTAHVGWVRG